MDTHRNTERAKELEKVRDLANHGYEMRMKFNGKRDRVRGIFDSQDNNRTITIFPVRSE